MAAWRIVASIAAGELAAARACHGELLGLDIAMDHGWIITSAAPGRAAPHRRALAAGHAVEWGPLTDPGGVRRFSPRAPFGRLPNILPDV